MHMIAVGLPESRLIVFHELHTVNPFGTLPEVKPGNHQAQRATMLGAYLLAVVVGGKEYVFLGSPPGIGWW